MVKEMRIINQYSGQLAAVLSPKGKVLLCEEMALRDVLAFWAEDGLTRFNELLPDGSDKVNITHLGDNPDQLKDQLEMLGYDLEII